MIGVKEKESQLSKRGIELIYGEPIGADECIAVILEEKRSKRWAKFGNTIMPLSKGLLDTNMPAASTEIYDKSMTLIRPQIQDVLSKAPKNQATIIERVVHTTADPEFAKLLVISDKAVDAGVAAIKAGAKIVTDVKMIKAGINEARVKKFGGKIITYMMMSEPQKWQLKSQLHVLQRQCA